MKPTKPVDLGSITEASGQQRLEAVAFLRAEGYKGDVQDRDRVFVAIDGVRIIGAVRLASEQGVTVLRGMRVSRPFQRQGVGRALLAKLDSVLEGRACYCIAYRWLRSFYGTIGFQPAQPADVPAFLAERYREYLAEGSDVILMRRSA
jgi:predicted N-acetyltransferase YhbS